MTDSEKAWFHRQLEVMKRKVEAINKRETNG